MPGGHAGNAKRPKQKGPQAIADILFWCETPEKRKELEEFRLEYERTHGPTDLTKRYTSMWPGELQDWLWTNHPKEFFDGLPPFAQAFMARYVTRHAQAGQLDNVSKEYIQLHIGGHLRLFDNDREQGRTR